VKLKVGYFYSMFLVFLLFFVCIQSNTAQTSEIKGIIKDKKTNELIIGANVILQSTLIGSFSNLNGEYSIKHIPSGRYNVVCSFISYKSIVIENVNIKEGEVISIHFELEEEIASLEGVVVTARRNTNTDISLINTIKSSQLVVSGISAQQIKQSQDSDAAQVVKRIPGVTVIGNRFIMIRGLSERYNAVMLHDVFAPSMEADVRSFSFDIVPSNLIDRILIFKSPSPELPGDFSGGVVKIYTKGVPDENSIIVGYSTRFRQGTSFNNFFAAKQNQLYLTGFNNGLYNLPNDFPNDIRNIENDIERLDEIGKSLPNQWVAIKSTAFLDQSFNVNFSRRLTLFKKDIGNITSLSYNNSKTSNFIERKDYNAYDFNLNKSSTIYEFDDVRYSNDIRLGVLHNWAMLINKNNQIELKTLFNQLSTSEYTHRTGPMYDFGYYANNHSFYQIYRGIFSGQLTGKHTFQSNNELNWVAGYGYSYRDEPDYRRYRSDLDTIIGNSTLYVPFGTAQAYFLGRFFSEMREHITTGSADYKHELLFPSINIKPKIQTGLFYEHKTRKFVARNIGYVRANLIQFDNNLLDVSIDSLFHNNNINHGNGIRIDEQTNPSDSYDAMNTVIASYILLSLPVTKKLNVNGGIRAENNIQQLNSNTIGGDPVNVEIDKVHLLPSVNISYNFTEKMLLRMAYGKTLNKPEFRELAPFGFYDFNYNLVRKGSDSIQMASIDNFDLRWELYPSISEIITVGIFYKRFVNPIENSFIPGGGSGGIKTFTFANADNAVSRGIEAEIRQSLNVISDKHIIANTSILFNAALIDSKVELGSASLGQGITHRAMYGQSPYILNVGFFYNDIVRNINITFMYNVIGRRIYIIGYDDYPNIYEMPRNLLDLSLTKTFSNNIELKIGIGNILDQDAVLLQDANNDGVFDRKNDQIIQRYKSGRTISAAISYKF